MTTIAPLAHFDRNRSFYPIVMHYCLALWGIVESGKRGFLDQIGFDYENMILDEMKKFRMLDESREAYSKLLVPLTLNSTVGKDQLTVLQSVVLAEFLMNHNYLLTFLPLFAGHLLTLAHEVCTERDPQNNDPIREFLRHSRNAASHGGKFSFTAQEPRRDASWGNLTILKSMQGTPLFKQSNIPGLLGLADPIYLLWDIEQAYPNL
jgi:hypothetical protein